MSTTVLIFAIAAFLTAMAAIGCTSDDTGRSDTDTLITQAVDCMVELFPQMTQAGVEQEFRQQLETGEKTADDLRSFVEEFCDLEKSQAATITSSVQAMGQPADRPKPYPTSSLATAPRIAVVLQENRLPDVGPAMGGLENIGPGRARFGPATGALLIEATHSPEAVSEYSVWWSGNHGAIEDRVWEYINSTEMYLREDERGNYLIVTLLPLKDHSGYAGHNGPLSWIQEGHIVVQHAPSGTEWQCSAPDDRNLRDQTVAFGCQLVN